MPEVYDPKTLDFYSQTSETYLGSRPDGVSRHLHSFLSQLPPAVSILELGCGAGRDAEAMMAAGFHVDPTDGVPEIAHVASKRLGRDVRVMRFDQLDATNAYDAVWANASLLHVPRDRLSAILKLIFNALKPGGLHFASFKGGGTEGRDDRARYYNYLAREEMIDFYEWSAGWEVLSAIEYTGGGGYELKKGPWVAITTRKPT